MKWFGLKETFQGGLVQPCNDQGLFHPDQAAQGPIQADLECSREGASTISLSSMSQCFITLVHSFFLYLV